MIKDIGFPQTNSKQRMWSSSEPGQNTEHERLQNFVGKILQTITNNNKNRKEYKPPHITLEKKNRKKKANG